MRIAVFHELDFGGARRTVSEFAKRLNKILDVDLYYIDDKKERGLRKNYKNVFYYPFHPKSWKGKNWKIRLYKDTIELFKLYNLHKKIALNIELKNYDYILVHPSKFTQAPFLLRFLSNKCIYYCQEPLRMVYDPYLSNISSIKFPKFFYEFLIRKIRKWIDIYNLKNTKTILANSNFSKEFIEKSYGKKAEVCYLGVETSLFKPLDIAKTIDVLFIGNKNKGYDLLNKSLKFFKTKPKVYTIFRKNKKKNVSDKELVIIYNKSKVLVALNQNEPFGLIPLEAMACGIPVIAVNEGGYRESIINGKTGYLTERNTKALRDLILRLLNNDKLRIDMGEDARKHVEEKWTWDKSTDRFLQIIKYAK